MYAHGSIFSKLQNNIAASMMPGIYATARTSIDGSFNAAQGESKQFKTDKNINIICGKFICEQQGDNNFFCN